MEKTEKTRLWNSIVKHAMPLKQPYRKLVASTITNYKTEFMNFPLTDNGKYSEDGGLLHATSDLVSLAFGIKDVINVDFDLLLAAAMLFFIGTIKRQELQDAGIDTNTPLSINVYTSILLMEQAKELETCNEEFQNKQYEKELYKLINIFMSDNDHIKEKKILNHLQQISFMD